VSGNVVRVDTPGSQGTKTTVYDYYPDNQRRMVIDPRGGADVYYYDALGRIYWELSGQLEDSCCIDGDVMVDTFWSYDDAGDITDVWADGRTSVTDGAHTHYQYNAAGEVVSELAPGGGNPTRYQRDLAGRVTKQTDPDGVVTDFTYDLAGRATSATLTGTDGSHSTTAYDYDADGRLVREQQPNGQVQTWTYDLAGDQTSTTEHLTAATTRTVVQGYDLDGHPVETTDAQGHTTWTTYNSWGLPEQVVEPPTASNPSPADRTWTYGYEPGGSVAALTSPGGATQQYTYDQLGQLTTVTAQDPSDSGANVTRHFGYSNAGDLTSIDTPQGTERYTWGSRGQLLSARGPIGNEEYVYDDYMRLMMVRSQDFPTSVYGRITQYMHDQSGRLTGITDSYNGKNVGVTRTYSQLTGLPDHDTYQSQLASTATIAYGYDAYGRRASDTVTNTSGVQVSQTQYHYDSLNNVTSQAVTNSQGTTTGSAARIGDSRAQAASAT